MKIIRNNAICELIFYVKVKHNNITTFTLKIQGTTKSIWKTIRPKFSNKYQTANAILLVENNNILQDGKAIANTFVNYFTDVTHSLGLKKKNIWLDKTLLKIKEKFRNSESVHKITESQRAAENSSFLFKVISEEEVKNRIKNLPITTGDYNQNS